MHTVSRAESLFARVARRALIPAVLDMTCPACRGEGCSICGETGRVSLDAAGHRLPDRFTVERLRCRAWPAAYDRAMGRPRRRLVRLALRDTFAQTDRMLAGPSPEMLPSGTRLGRVMLRVGVLDVERACAADR